MVPIDLEEVPAQPYAGPRLDDRGPRVVFFGIPSDYGTAFLLHLIEKRVNLVAVVCSTRWQRTHPKADLIARIAGYLGRPVEVTADANSEAFVRCLHAYEPDIVVMASFDQILTAQTLAVPTRGWLNVHPSLLPRHRGPEPIYWTIVEGDREVGRASLADGAQEHGGETVDGVGGHALTRREVGEGVVGAEDVGRAVHQEDVIALGRLAWL